MKPLITVPSFNSAQTLRVLLPQLKQFQLPILVVDDGSRDQTQTVCVEERVESVLHETNLGLSQAMQTAFRFAEAHGFSHVLALDSDCQHDPDCIPEFLKSGLSADLVIGSRFPAREPVPTSKICSNFFASSLVEEAFGVFYPDVSCGYRLYRCASFLDCPVGVGYEIVIASMVWAIRKRLIIKPVRVPVIYPPDVLLATKTTELVSALPQFLDTAASPKVTTILESISARRGFAIEMAGAEFFAFYLDSYDSYLFQCELSAVEAKYRRYEARDLHPDTQ